MDRTTFKNICRTRRLSWGTLMIEHMTSHTARTLARAGYDWLWIDNEHGYHSYETLQEIIRTCDDVGMVPIVRVTQREYGRIAQALDMGVSGVIIPRVQTPDEAREVMEYAKYPPIGKRGFGIRGNLFPPDKRSMKDRMEDQNQRLLIIQLESPEAIDALPKMLEVTEGQVDAVFYGPADFQVSIGKPDQPDCEEVLSYARKMTSVCAAHNISNGLPALTPDEARKWVELGFNLICYRNDDMFLADAAEEGREELRVLEEDLRQEE